MEISFDKINATENPYEKFIDSIKSEETKRKYKSNLHRFLKLIPNKVYSEAMQDAPKDNELETLATYFVKLSNTDSKLAYNIISAYVKEEKKLVEFGGLNPNTLPNHIKPIKALLDSNAIALHWKSLYKMYPRERKSEDRAYTREELQRMIEVASDITDKLIVQLFSSGGFRVEAWDYFSWKDVVFFENKDGSYRGAALLVYRGDPESYWTFITPEACETLQHYKEFWKSQVGREPRPDEPLIKSEKFPVIRRLNSRGIKRRLLKMVTKIGLRPPLKEGQKRHEVPLDHGFRKYFNTMMRRAKVNYLDKEDMMGHSVGLERHYERYQEDDFERFPEYQKAIPFLTISEEERQKVKIESLEKIKENLESKQLELENLQSNMDTIIEQKISKYNEKFIKEIEKMYEKENSRLQNRLVKIDEKFIKENYSTK